MKSPGEKAPKAGRSAADPARGAVQRLPAPPAPTQAADTAMDPALAQPGAPGDRQAPDPRLVQRLQGVVGNRAVAGLVAQRYSAPVKPPPSQAPGFRRVQADVAAKKRAVAQHPPAAAES
ncbi:hypothetical protein ACH4B3_32615, partial [Streptomyces sp. NPDC018031]